MKPTAANRPVVRAPAGPPLNDGHRHQGALKHWAPGYAGQVKDLGRPWVLAKHPALFLKRAAVFGFGRARRRASTARASAPGLRGGLLWLALLSLAGGCTESPAERITFEVRARSEGPPALTQGEATLTLTRAALTVSAIYLCASSTASIDLCSEARGEMLPAVVVDALDPNPIRIGEGEGFEGRRGGQGDRVLRSAQLSYGVQWLLTAARPALAPGAQASLHLEGSLETATTLQRVNWRLEVAPTAPGRSTAAVTFAPAVLRRDAVLTLVLTPAAWLAQLDLASLAERGEDEVALEPDSPAHSALVQALTSSAPPRFEFR